MSVHFSSEETAATKMYTNLLLLLSLFLEPLKKPTRSGFSMCFFMHRPDPSFVVVLLAGELVHLPTSFTALDQHSPLLDYTTHLSLSGLVGTVQSYVCVCDLALSRITVPISALVNYQKLFF